MQFFFLSLFRINLREPVHRENESVLSELPKSGTSARCLVPRPFERLKGYIWLWPLLWKHRKVLTQTLDGRNVNWRRSLSAKAIHEGANFQRNFFFLSRRMENIVYTCTPHFSLYKSRFPWTCWCDVTRKYVIIFLYTGHVLKGLQYLYQNLVDKNLEIRGAFFK